MDQFSYRRSPQARFIKSFASPRPVLTQALSLDNKKKYDDEILDDKNPDYCIVYKLKVHVNTSEFIGLASTRP